MNDRILKPILEVSKQPKETIRFLHSCQSTNDLTKFAENISLECFIKNIDLNPIHKLNFYVSVSLVEQDSPYFNHPFNLKCTNRSIRLISEFFQELNSNLVNSYFFELDKTTMTCQIDNLSIETKNKEQVESFYEKKVMKEILLSPIAKNSNNSNSSSNNANINDVSMVPSSPISIININECLDKLDIDLNNQIKTDLNKCRLKLQVIIYDTEKNKLDNYLTEPVYTRVIENSVNKPNESENFRQLMIVNNNSSYMNNYYQKSMPKINRCSRISGSLNGNDEIFLFVTPPFDPNDLEVEFFQLKKDTEVCWRALAYLDKTDIHCNSALVIRTPKFNGLFDITQEQNQQKEQNTKSMNTTDKAKFNNNSTNNNKRKNKIKVYFHLFRPSTKEYSEKWTFFYYDDDNYEFKTLFEEHLADKNFRRKFGLKFFNKNNIEMNQIKENPTTTTTTSTMTMTTTTTKSLDTNDKEPKKRKKPFDSLNEEPNENLNIDDSNDYSDSNDIIDIQSPKSNISNNVDDENDELINVANDLSGDDCLDSGDELKTNREDTDFDNSNRKKKPRLNSDIKVIASNNNNKSGQSNTTTTNDNDYYSSSNSPIALLTRSTKRLTIDSESQTNISIDANKADDSNVVSSNSLISKKSFEAQTNLTIPPKYSFNIFNTLESLFTISPSDAAKLSVQDLQIKNSLDTCVGKMNSLAERTGKSLLKFFKTRSLHELIKTQRFLLNVQDDDGNTPMHLSIIHGNYDLLEIIVDISLTIPYHNLINLKNFKQLTPLLVAAHLGESEVCEFLLEANADLLQTDLYGCNPLHIACKNKDVNLLKILLKYVEKSCNYSILNNINHDGYAPIHLAVLNQSTDLVRELLYMKNLKINIQDKRTGYTALHHAASDRNLLSICNMLINNSSIILDVRAFNGCTPLHIAIANTNYLITAALINHGANLNLQCDMHVHCDIEIFQAAIKKNNILRRCVDNVVNSYKQKQQLINKPTKNDDQTTQSDQQINNKQIIDSNHLYVKLSEEVKKTYDDELEKQKIDDPNDSKSRPFVFQHNYDAYFYAQNDPWMLELFKNRKTIKRDLLEKIMCYETFRKIYYEIQSSILSTSKLSTANLNTLISTSVKISKEKLNYLEANKSFGQIKISQQETGHEEIETQQTNLNKMDTV